MNNVVIPSLLKIIWLRSYESYWKYITLVINISFDYFMNFSNFIYFKHISSIFCIGFQNKNELLLKFRCYTKVQNYPGVLEFKSLFFRTVLSSWESWGECTGNILCTPYFYTCRASPITNIPHHSHSCVTTDGPGLIHHYHPSP